VIQNICFSEELWPFPRESTLFLGEGVLLPKELGPFPKENSLLLGEIVFFHQGIFFIPWGTCLGLAFNLFFPREIIS
jgi:hypothetical protein